MWVESLRGTKPTPPLPKLVPRTINNHDRGTGRVTSTLGHKYIDAVFACATLSVVEIAVLVFLAHKANDSDRVVRGREVLAGESWPGYEAIELASGCSVRSIRRAIKRAAALGILEAIEVGYQGRTSKTYILYLDRLRELAGVGGEAAKPEIEHRDRVGREPGGVGEEAAGVGREPTKLELTPSKLQSSIAECNSASELAALLFSLLDEPAASFNTAQWAADLDSLPRSVRNSYEFIRTVMLWAYKTGPSVIYWQTRTHNMTNFVKHFSTLTEQMERAEATAKKRTARVAKKQDSGKGKKEFQKETIEL